MARVEKKPAKTAAVRPSAKAKVEEPKAEEPKAKPVEKKKPEFDLAAKIERIEASRLPAAEKERMVKKLKIADAKPEKKVLFGAYANQKGLSDKMRKAMAVYPKAKDVVSATVEQWDEIFKDF